MVKELQRADPAWCEKISLQRHNADMVILDPLAPLLASLGLDENSNTDVATFFSWWSDVINEAHAGDHTPVVRIGLRYGFILFIMSEVMFFSAWFWSFFKHALYPMGPMSPLVDGVFPPEGIQTFDPWHLPLINTLILLLSGVAVTWAHHAFVHDGDTVTNTTNHIHLMGNEYDGEA
mgnify:CR=1 FL=1